MSLHRFAIRPQIAPSLGPVFRLAKNLMWTYDPEIQLYFTELREKLVTMGKAPRPNASPAEWLSRLSMPEQHKLGADKRLLERAHYLEQRLDRALQKKPGPWSDKAPNESLVAYFSAEYGIHECLPIYAGGLGILAGDHLKSASALGLPLVAVGLFYHHGYHEQHIEQDGAPNEYYLRTNPTDVGATLCTLEGGGRLTVQVLMRDRLVHLQVWELGIGSVRLFLLDADIAENSANDRQITATLYGGDESTRIEQELALGVGGVFALQALGIKASVFHLNEGHAAFLSLARLHELCVQHKLSIEEAAEIVAASSVFTTHTPIAAGNDVFMHDSLMPYLEPLAKNLELPLSWLVAQAAEDPAEAAFTRRFSMTAFAIHLCGRRNGVSLEHGTVSRRLWHKLWPGRLDREIPIGAVVNGVHLPTWTAPAMARHYSEPRPDVRQFWADKNALRARLVEHVMSDTPHSGKLVPGACTIGFARRFAEYKRALLLFSDPERLRRLLTDPARPVQLLFAGKAHPNNQREKSNIKLWHELVRKLGLEDRVVFVENYNMSVARMLVQGVDVWLNTPRPPLEASGTSGMKIIMNGALNVSVLDGWWKEGYEPGLGWAVGELHERDSIAAREAAYRDEQDAISLYNVLEKEVIPLFYQRDDAGVPRAWVEKCLHSGQALAPKFSSYRMVEQYAAEYYWPAHEDAQRLTAAGKNTEAKKLAAARAQLDKHWSSVSVQLLGELPEELELGDRFRVRAKVTASHLTADQLKVDLVVGSVPSPRATPDGEPVTSPYQLDDAVVCPMTLGPGDGPGQWLATAEVEGQHVGAAAFTIRVTPNLKTGRVTSHVLLG